MKVLKSIALNVLKTLNAFITIQLTVGESVYVYHWVSSHHVSVGWVTPN